MSRSGFVNVDQSRGKLYALCGLPHAGKSTWANSWAKESIITQRPRVVLAGDDFRWALTGHEYLPHAEAHVLAVIDTAALALIRRGFDVLIDETSTSKPTLMRYLRIDPHFKLIFIDTPADECRRRVRETGREYLLPVIDRLEPRLNRLKQEWEQIKPKLLEEVEHRMTGDVTIGLISNEDPIASTETNAVPNILPISRNSKV